VLYSDSEDEEEQQDPVGQLTEHFPASQPRSTSQPLAVKALGERDVNQAGGGLEKRRRLLHHTDLSFGTAGHALPLALSSPAGASTGGQQPRSETGAEWVGPSSSRGAGPPVAAGGPAAAPFAGRGGQGEQAIDLRDSDDDQPEPRVVRSVACAAPTC